ncbi:MAG: hypothetical protein AABZ53_01530 [Planctomycetota bacterium]
MITGSHVGDSTLNRRSPIRSRLLTTLIAMVCLFAQLGVATSGLWHHHDDEDADHPSCSVCVAVASDANDGLPPSAGVAFGPALVWLVEPGAQRDPSAMVTLDCRVRGPPLA